jgi:uncharacterized protein YndB with AHSA1/START domain
VTRAAEDRVAEIPPRLHRTVVIGAAPTAVWQALTEPALMRQWMGEPEMQIAIDTAWTLGGPFARRR